MKANNTSVINEPPLNSRSVKGASIPRSLYFFAFNVLYYNEK